MRGVVTESKGVQAPARKVSKQPDARTVTVQPDARVVTVEGDEQGHADANLTFSDGYD